MYRLQNRVNSVRGMKMEHETITGLWVCIVFARMATTNKEQQHQDSTFERYGSCNSEAQFLKARANLPNKTTLTVLL